MRTTNAILGLIHERGTKGLPLERVHRLLYNPNLYLTAYGKLYRNQGAMTEGVTEETVEGMSQEKIERTIETLRDGTFQWKPVRRVYIPKKDGKKRPLGLPDWPSKMVQEVIRLMLNAYYEPQFSEHSHGFRPERGCHTALREIKKWDGTTWFIEGDISKCFERLDHQVLLSMLQENIHDEPFIKLIRELLEAGYLRGLEIPCDAKRYTARRSTKPTPCKYLPRQTGYLHRTGTHSRVYQRERAEDEPSIRKAGKRKLPPQKTRANGRSKTADTADAETSLPGP